MTKRSDKDGWERIAKGWHYKSVAALPEHVEPLTAQETYRAYGVRTPSIDVRYHHIDGSPLLRPDGTQLSRARLADPPDGKSKYRGRAGDGVHLHLPPGLLQWLKENPKLPLRFVEGEAKSLFRAGCVGFQGTAAWQSKGVPAPEFEELKPYLRGRRVEIVPDSDVPSNPQSKKWIARLLRYVATLGAKSVRYVPLPTLHINSENIRKSKTGFDDFIADRGYKAFKELPRIPWDHSQFKDWDAEAVDDGLPDALINPAPIPAEWIDPDKDPPSIEWAINGLVAMGETTMCVGGAGSGKTTVTVNMAIGMALGRSVLNLTITKPRRVLYAMLERHEHGFWRRVRKAVQCLFPHLSHEERETLRANFFRGPPAGEPVRLVEYRQNQWTIHAANVDALIESMRQNGIMVLIFDTLSRLHGGNSNDDSLATALTTVFERITQATGAAVIVLAHTGKMGRDDKYALRGSSAWVDNTSNMVHLRALTEEECGKVKILAGRDVPRDVLASSIIVEMEHRRMAETTTHPTQYFAIKKGDPMNGWMWSVGVRANNTPSDILEKSWFRELGDFTENAFVRACQHHEEMGRPTARKRFHELRKSGDIEDTSEERKGGRLYRAANIVSERAATTRSARRSKAEKTRKKCGK